MTLIVSQFLPNDESSDDRTITTDSDSSAAQSFEDAPCKLETDSKEIEATLNQIASGLQNAAEGYLTLASHISKLGTLWTTPSNSPNTLTTYGSSYAH